MAKDAKDLTLKSRAFIGGGGNAHTALPIQIIGGGDASPRFRCLHPGSANPRVRHRHIFTVYDKVGPVLLSLLRSALSPSSLSFPSSSPILTLEQRVVFCYINSGGGAKTAPPVSPECGYFQTLG